MPDLIAQGPTSEDRWRRELPGVLAGAEIVIGREGADWNVPWDNLISRAHVSLRIVEDGRVEVRCSPKARNPVFHRGQKAESFTLAAGEHFVIGGTTFTLANRPDASDSSTTDDNVTEHAFDHLALRRRHFRDAGSRIEMLSRLPELITSSGSDEELLVRVTSVLLQATPSASAVAIASATPINDADDENLEVEILHYDSRIPGKDGPPVSARLVRSTVKKRESVMHLWSAGRHEAAFTASEDVDWAFCVPLRSEACPGWALYVTGQLAADLNQNINQSLQSAPDELQDDVKFAELVGTTIANLRQSRRLQRRQSAMRNFFAPVVLEALAGRESEEVLEPREANLSVMFCDLRSFSQKSERNADDLLQLLADVSDALGVMTRHILDVGGVIGDFHGDAAMGFWGWPLEQDDTAIRAATAATRILKESHSATNAEQGSVSGFRFGIGIATGRAVAGRIGTADQVKVTAFGPVVNLASRLEGMTKAFGAEVVVDQPTAEKIKQCDRPDLRIRRLAVVRPAGFQKSVEVFQLLGPPIVDAPSLGEEEIEQYEASLEALNAGRWEEAHRLLHALPAWDRPKDVLLSIILRHNRVPPENWNGIIDLPKL